MPSSSLRLSPATKAAASSPAPAVARQGEDTRSSMARMLATCRLLADSYRNDQEPELAAEFDEECRAHAAYLIGLGCAPSAFFLF